MAVRREPKTVFTFPTTTFALEAERLCKIESIPGRLIPVPSQISAGCGMAWCFPPEAAKAVEELLLRKNITVQGVYELEI